MAASAQPVTHGALAAKALPSPVIGPTVHIPPPDLARAVQRPLFHEKVVPIQALPRRAEPRRRADSPSGAVRPKAQVRRGPRHVENQGTLDFLPSSTARPRTLGTTVEAVIYCEAPVAAKAHRAVAAAMDWGMVLIAFGMFLLSFLLWGGRIPAGRPGLIGMGGMFLVIAFAYGAIWAIAGCETAGMRWAQLRLITFDGFPPERTQRLYRFIASCMTYGTVAGLLWPLGDEESLGWPDHISRTFLTPVDTGSHVIRQR